MAAMVQCLLLEMSLNRQNVASAASSQQNVLSIAGPDTSVYSVSIAS